MGLFSNQTVGEELPSENGQAAAASVALNNAKSGRGGKRPGSGRPKIDAPPRAAKPPVEETPVATPEDIEFCRKAAQSVLEMIDGYMTKRVKNAVESIDTNLGGAAEEFAERVAINQKDIQMVSDATAAVAAKYAALTRFMPEVMLAGWTASYAMRCTSVLKEIKELRMAVIKVNIAKQAEPAP